MGRLSTCLCRPAGTPPAACRFFTRALSALKVIPTEVVTDAAPVCPGVFEERLCCVRPSEDQGRLDR
jgi:hypothetical protein